MQRFSHYPGIPLPQLSPKPGVVEFDASDCVYLPGLRSRMRGFWAGRMSAEAYQSLMDAGFRRSGRVIYQPVCSSCRACSAIRVPVERFAPSKSQRRCWRKNADVVVSVGPPEATLEKHALYSDYQARWHGGAQASEYDDFVGFLYDSPVETLEFVYRLAGGRLLGVGICDVTPKCVSSVYFYFDPKFAERGAGTYSAMYEIAWARARGIPYWYAGYHVAGCGAMEYKASFRPNERLGGDGEWRESAPAEGGTPE